MKIALFNDFKPGVVKDQMVVDVSEPLKAFTATSPQATIEAIITHFKELAPEFARLAQSNRGVALDQVRLRPPVPQPSKVLCCIGNFKEGGVREHRDPEMFLKSPASVIGHGDTVELPPAQANIFHHEAELALVIGKPTTKVSVSEGMGSIFGYTTFIDVSARGFGTRSFIGKSFDTFAPIGPWIVTADEIPDPHTLAIKIRVNGEIRQDYNTDDIDNPIPTLVEYASAVTTLLPGDLIACGTNHQGLGAMQDGDTVEIEIEKIGKMSVTVKDPLKRSWPRGIDEEFARRIRGA